MGGARAVPFWFLPSAVGSGKTRIRPRCIVGKYALRALSQSLAKEFGPQGVHVAHAVIDGVIDIPRTKEWMQEAGPDAKISPDAVSTSTPRAYAELLPDADELMPVIDC